MSAHARRTRRKRRQDRARLRNRSNMVRHSLKAGRTGSVHHKKLKGAMAELERRAVSGSEQSA